jgi:hypothetical protein
MAKHKYHRTFDILRQPKFSRSMKLLQISKLYRKFSPGIGPKSNFLTVKEVNYESVKSIKNLV